jgi:hypothetical protein
MWAVAILTMPRRRRRRIECRLPRQGADILWFCLLTSSAIVRTSDLAMSPNGAPPHSRSTSIWELPRRASEIVIVFNTVLRIHAGWRAEGRHRHRAGHKRSARAHLSRGRVARCPPPSGTLKQRAGKKRNAAGRWLGYRGPDEEMLLLIQVVVMTQPSNPCSQSIRAIRRADRSKLQESHS